MVVTYVCLRCVVSSLNVIRYYRKDDEQVRWRESKCVFMNRFLFAAWNIGFAFGAARLVKFKLVSVETKLTYEKLKWQRV